MYLAEPQPTTREEFQDAERGGDLVAATGHGVALGIDDRPILMHPGERLHVLRVDATTGEVLVRRLDEHTLARVSREGIEVRATNYPG